MLANKIMVVTSPSDAAIGVAMLSGLMLYLKDLHVNYY